MQSDVLLISIRPQYAEKIFDGSKTVELRRLRPRVSNGDRVVVYASTPVKAVIGDFTVDRVVESSPSKLWQEAKYDCGLTKEEFDNYFKGTRTAFGIYIRKVKKKRKPVPLFSLRNECPGFHPPQGYRYLKESRMSDIALRTQMRL